MVQASTAMWETQVRSLGWEDPREKEMATYSSTLTWKIPWMEEPCRLQSMGLQRVGHDWAISLSLTTETWASQVALVVKNPSANVGDVRDMGSNPGSGRSPGEGNGNPLQYSCLENPMDRGAWQATVYGMAQLGMTGHLAGTQQKPKAFPPAHFPGPSQHPTRQPPSFRPCCSSRVLLPSSPFGESSFKTR